jgi:hypothetical protein
MFDGIFCDIHENRSLSGANMAIAYETKISELQRKA